MTNRNRKSAAAPAIRCAIYTRKSTEEGLGVPRTTLNDWMRRIRRRFENAGMQDYLES